MNAVQILFSSTSLILKNVVDSKKQFINFNYLQFFVAFFYFSRDLLALGNENTWELVNNKKTKVAEETPDQFNI